MKNGLLSLSLTGASSETASLTEELEIRAGRIPERSLGGLSDGSEWRATLMGFAWLFFLIELFGAGAALAGHPEDPRPLVMIALFFGIAALATIVWVLPRSRCSRDLRERRLSFEDDMLTKKWTKTETVYREDNGSMPMPRHRRFWKIVALMSRSGDPDDWPIDRREVRETRWIRIAGRAHPIHSATLFAELAEGGLYRVYLSMHTRQLVAIESPPERPAGYRDAPESREASHSTRRNTP